MKPVRSIEVPTAPAIGVWKLGQPVPLSNFVSDVKRGWPQPAQTNRPGRFSLLSGLDPGISVPWHRSTLYCVGDRVACHSSSVFVELTKVDAKQRTSYLANRAAHLELARGRKSKALEYATKALAPALAVGRATEISVARAIIVESADDPAVVVEGRKQLEALDAAVVSAFARGVIERALGATGDYNRRRKGAHHGARDRRTRLR